MNKKLVYNLDPEGYNKDAILIWEKNRFDYVEGCFEDIKNIIIARYLDDKDEA